MPHRVATFFRSHSASLDPSPTPKKPARSASSHRADGSTPSEPPSSSSVPSEEKNLLKMPDNALKRLSLGGRASPNRPKHPSPRSSSTRLSPSSATLDVLIESPPLVFYGAAQSSSGALLSGQIRLHIGDEKLEFTSFTMKLSCDVTRKKPFHGHCQECQHQSTELTAWAFLKGPTTLRRGVHDFPFSFLLPGHLPATMKGSISIIDYVLHAACTPKGGEAIVLSRKLNIKRAVYPPDQPRHSIRIFPPTNLTANCDLPPVIYPIGENTMSLAMDGIVKRNPDTKTQTQWRLKRLTWRLDETQRAISPACAKHAAKLGSDAEETKKGVAHQDVRTIGTDEIKSGWKSDYTSADGRLELEFPFRIRPDAKPICDMKAEDGTQVSHVLIVEMIVSEEFAPIKKPTQVTPTGAARVLRMHFNITLTERSGLGISWDEEQPPLYENVPASPPGYRHGDMQDYEGDAIPNYEDLTPLGPVVGASSDRVTSNGEGGSGTVESFQGNATVSACRLDSSDLE